MSCFKFYKCRYFISIGTERVIMYLVFLQWFFLNVITYLCPPMMQPLGVRHLQDPKIPNRWKSITLLTKQQHYGKPVQYQHVPCFYRVIEKRVQVWENEKCCGNTSRRRVFPQLFRFLPNFHECFITRYKHEEHIFYFFWRTARLWLLKCKLSLLAPSLRQKLVLVMCLYRVIKKQDF